MTLLGYLHHKDTANNGGGQFQESGTTAVCCHCADWLVFRWGSAMNLSDPGSLPDLMLYLYCKITTYNIRNSSHVLNLMDLHQVFFLSVPYYTCCTQWDKSVRKTVSDFRVNMIQVPCSQLWLKMQCQINRANHSLLSFLWDRNHCQWLSCDCTSGNRVN